MEDRYTIIEHPAHIPGHRFVVQDWNKVYAARVSWARRDDECNVAACTSRAAAEAALRLLTL